MQEIIDYKNYKGKKTFNDFVSLLDEYGINALINVIKQLGVTLDIYDEGVKYEKLINKIENYIIENQPKEDRIKWKNVKKESELINSLNREFNNISQHNTKCSNPIETFLIITEQILFYTNNIINNQPEKNKKLNSYIKFNDINDINEYIDLNNKLSSIINKIGVSLIFYEHKHCKINPNVIINEDELKLSFNHFNNVQFYDMLNYLIESWKFGGRKITSNGDKVKFEITGNLDKNFFLSNERTNSKEDKIYLETLQIIANNDIESIQGETLDKYLDEEEFLTSLYLAEILCCNDLLECECIMFNNESFSLMVLIRAYYILKNLSKRFIKSIDINNYSLSNWIITITKEELKEEFCRYGIDEHLVDKIISLFIYKKSTDIFDTPLIKIDKNNYLIVPNIVVLADPSRTILSCIKEVPKRGTDFEKEILEKFRSSGINASPIYYEEGEEKYQCDIAFCIEDNLYFGECKSFNNSKSIRGHYDFQLKLLSATKQLERISNKLSNKIDLINQSLGYDKEHKFKSVQNIIITSNMLGLDRKINKTYLIDKSSLVKFLDREKPSKNFTKDNKLYKIEYKGFNGYKGNITNKKFISMIKAPCSIIIASGKSQKIRAKMKFERTIIEYDIYDVKYRGTQMLR